MCTKFHCNIYCVLVVARGWEMGDPHMNILYFHVMKFTIRTHTHIQTATHTTNSTLKLVTNQTKHTSSLELSVRSGYNSMDFSECFADISSCWKCFLKTTWGILTPSLIQQDNRTGTIKMRWSCLITLCQFGSSSVYTKHDKDRGKNIPTYLIVQGTKMLAAV